MCRNTWRRVNWTRYITSCCRSTLSWACTSSPSTSCRGYGCGTSPRPASASEWVTIWPNITYYSRPRDGIHCIRLCFHLRCASMRSEECVCKEPKNCFIYLASVSCTGNGFANFLALIISIALRCAHLGVEHTLGNVYATPGYTKYQIYLLLSLCHTDLSFTRVRRTNNWRDARACSNISITSLPSTTKLFH